MRHTRSRLWLLFCCCTATLLLNACKPVGPDYSKPAVQAPVSYKESAPDAPRNGAWLSAVPRDGAQRGAWWMVFGDTRLNALEERVTAANPDLRRASENYFAAHAQAVAARSAYLPTLSAGPTLDRARVSQNGVSYNSKRPDAYNDLYLTGSVGWEPDFFGRVRRTVEAAKANAQADAADFASLNLSLHAELAQDYFALRAVDSQDKLLALSIEDLEKLLALTEQRLAGGVAVQADVEQARTQLESTRAQRVDLEVSRAQLEHAIGTLTGTPLTEFQIAHTPLELDLPAIPEGIPSQLLERRPDIAAAERRVAQANAQIGVARSAYYPSISLSASGGFESVHGGTWIQGPSSLWSLGAQGAALLFDGGQRRALTDEARHTYEAQSAAYQSTVLNAFREVEDELSALHVLKEEAAIQQRAVESARRSRDLSKTRYEGGVTNYLDVLVAENTLIANERTAVDLRNRQFAADVLLIRALGGGWDTAQLLQ